VKNRLNNTIPDTPDSERAFTVSPRRVKYLLILI